MGQHARHLNIVHMLLATEAPTYLYTTSVALLSLLYSNSTTQEGTRRSPKTIVYQWS